TCFASRLIRCRRSIFGTIAIAYVHIERHAKTTMLITALRLARRENSLPPRRFQHQIPTASARPTPIVTPKLSPPMPTLLGCSCAYWISPTAVPAAIHPPTQTPVQRGHLTLSADSVMANNQIAGTRAGIA